MERKGRPRLLPVQIPMPRTVSRIAAAALTGCLIICILAGTVPAGSVQDSWSITADRVYAAETASLGETGSETAGEKMPEDVECAREVSGEDSVGQKEDQEEDKEDRQEEDDSSQAQDADASEDTSLPLKDEPESAADASAGASLPAEESASMPEEESSSLQETEPERESASQPEKATGREPAPAPAAAQSSETGSEKGNSSASDPASTDSASSNAALDPSVSDTAEAASTQAVTVTEEPWMTVTEFERAYNSVTGGAIGGDGYVPSQATIVSKESEIDYESLGIGKDVPGHRGHTTPVRIQDEQGNVLIGLCVVPDDRGHQTWSVLPDVKRVTDAVMIKLYYYTMLDNYGEKLASQRGFGSKSGSVAVAACHEAMSMRYAELAGISYDRPNIGDDFRSLVNAYRSGAASKSLPDLNKVHVYMSGRIQKQGHWLQAYVFGFTENDVPAGVSLQKICSDPDMREPYSESYCLHETSDGGTVNFRVYTDKACTKKAHVYTDKNMTNERDYIPVGMSGKHGVWNNALFFCEPGTYYLKEMNTPKGYQVHSEAFGPYTVKDGQGLTIKIPNTPRYARAGIIKKDVATAKALAGAKYGLYSSKEDARNEEGPIGVFTTGADGKSNLLEVLAHKTYYVREISAPRGYKTDANIYALNVADSVTATVWTELTDEPDVGKIRVKKASSDLAAVTDTENSLYSLEGAVYTLYNENGESAGTLKTGKDGTSAFLTVQCGTYTLRETEPSPGFALDKETYNVTVTGGSEITVDSTEPVLKGKITVKKVSSEEKEEKAPDTLPITGAVYSLYNSEEDAAEERASAGTFVIQKDGTSKIVEVIAGKTYYVKETKTPEGYIPDEKIYPVKVDSLTELFTVQSEDRLIFGGVRICKRDLETGEQTPLGGASLEGTVIRIFNDGDLSVYADGRKVLPGAEAVTLVTGSDGAVQTSARALSYGRYRAEEVLAPEGYTRKGAEPVRFSVTEDGKITDLSASADTSIRNRVMRGDFSIRKINGYTQRRMAGVTFEVTAFDRDGREIEKHRFTTDENGYFESTAAWASQQRKKNSRKSGEQQDGNTGDSAGSAQTEQDDSGRIWFGAGTEPDDSLGALPFGSYHIEEIEGENNRGMKMFSDDFSIYADGQKLTLGNIENTLKPVLDTELVDENGDHFADQKGMVTLTDTVTYAGMEEYIGKEVTFHGVIYVKETGKPLQIDGKTIESVQTRKILSQSGTVQLRFTFDASKAQGMTLVCFEYASEPVSAQGGSAPEKPAEGEPGTETAASDENEKYHDSTNGGKDIVSHKDLEDQSQTVHLVSIETDAEDQLTGMRIGQARGGAVTVDHVTCRGLTPGQKYVVTGFLVDKSTGRPLRDHEGARITAKASFTAEKSEEVIDLTFTYDASLLEGTTVVAFERLYLGGDGTPAEPDENPDKPGEETPDQPDTPDQDEPGSDTPIAVHEDPDDEDQSIHYPRIRTSAEAGKDSADKGENSAVSSDGEISLRDSGTEMEKTVTADKMLIVRDHVTWENLIPDQTYRLQGVLMDKGSNKPFSIDGKPVTARAQFTPKTKDGETYMYFRFDGTGLFADPDTENTAGRGVEKTDDLQTIQLVAFEELYVYGQEPSEGSSSGNVPDGTGEDAGKEGKDPAEKTDQQQADGEEYLVAVHKDLEDPAQTVFVREPQRPAEPEKPARPLESRKQENPEKTQTSHSQRKKINPASPETVRTGSPVKTGDDTKTALYLLLLLVSGIAAAGIVLVKKHLKNSEK